MEIFILSLKCASLMFSIAFTLSVIGKIHNEQRVSITELIRVGGWITLFCVAMGWISL